MPCHPFLYHLETTVFPDAYYSHSCHGSDDGLSTYEISRSWNTEKKKALLIALYPTIDVYHVNSLDLSSIYLLNHATQMNLGTIRILNLYYKVQTGRPLVSNLREDLENLAYISDVFEDPDIADYYIILAWGSSLSNHQLTINTKLQILQMIKDKGLTNNAMQLTTDDLDTVTSSGVHPLYLGLHHNRSFWSLSPYPFETELKELSSMGTLVKETTTNTKKGKKKKCTTE